MVGDGEITPVMALKMVQEDMRYGSMRFKDFSGVTEELKAKTRCYGYVLTFLFTVQPSADTPSVSALCWRSSKSVTLLRTHSRSVVTSGEPRVIFRQAQAVRGDLAGICGNLPKVWPDIRIWLSHIDELCYSARI